MSGIKTVISSIASCIRKFIHVWLFELRSIVLSYKWLVLSLISFMLVSLYMKNIVSFADTYDLGVYPAALAFFFEDYTFCNIGMLALIFVMSTFPVTNKLQQGVLLRSGRLTWAAGQMFTVVTVSVLWFIEMMLFVCILLGEHLDLSGWGQVWGSLSGDMSSGADVGITVSKRVILGFKPWEAVLISAVFVVLTGAIYGLIIFCIDGLTKSYVGEVLLSVWSMAWIVIGSFEFIADNRYIRMFSPRNWLSLDKYIGNQGDIYINIGIMTGIIAVLWLLGSVLVKKQRIIPE